MKIRYLFLFLGFVGANHCEMSVSMKNVDPAFQGVGQKMYPINQRQCSYSFLGLVIKSQTRNICFVFFILHYVAAEWTFGELKIFNLFLYPSLIMESSIQEILTLS